ncbi:MAG: UDP-N-acetylglucosamine 1-carboxyvinyltransferase, partial [Verrucomicrobiota bacterium]
NAALPMLAAAVLTDEPVVLRNLPLIEDVMVMIQILNDLGARTELKGHTLHIDAADLRKRSIDQALCRKVRGSILFAGPLAARHGRAELSPPGGDVIGTRRLDTHFQGLAALGIDIDGTTTFKFVRKNLKAAKILLDEASVTATENIMMAATLAKGVTVLYNAACEPHVEDLGRLLNRMGAKISGLGTNRLEIRGVSRLHGTTHRIGTDYIEAGSFMAAAAATGGEITLNVPDHAISSPIIQRAFRKLGLNWTAKGSKIVVGPKQPLKILPDFGSAIPKIEDGPWPAFPSDLMSVAIVLATQARGQVLFFEKMFESRMYFADQLVGMGARIVPCDPHRIVVSGPNRLLGTHISSPDIRAGMALVIAALCAKGTSTIENVQMIDRGYEKIDQRLRDLGADIERVES